MNLSTRLRARLSRASLVAMLAVSALGTSGCFGNFSLTRKLYSWNDGLGNKWVKSLAFWGLNIIPVYGLVGFGDTIVLNVVEFWTGSNPVADARDVKSRELEDGSLEVAYRGDTFRLVPTSETTFDVTRNGEAAGHATVRPDGSLALVTPKGTAEIYAGDGPGAAQRF